MLTLPDKYNLEYLVFSVCGSLSEEEYAMNIELHKLFKRMMFKKFDSYIEEEMSNGNRP